MEQTPPPDLLSYNQGGLNHTFYAVIDICGRCHEEMVDGESAVAGFNAASDTLQLLIEDPILNLITDSDRCRQQHRSEW